MSEIRAPIFDVQRFSIHDGPGIRTLVFFKGCNLRCAWCHNPESQEPRPRLGFRESRCAHSGACRVVCPRDAIRLQGLRIDYARCDFCLKCVDACAHGALQPVGEKRSPEEVMAVILKDRNYFETSNGGVTFSGGEPTLYPRFMERMLALCADEAIHTVLETCGAFSYDRWRNMLRQFDLIYFDLKIMDATKHRSATGADNRRILRNAELLVSEGYPVEFRLPLVEGYTDNFDNLIAVVEFLHKLQRTTLHLLGYHNMGESKLAMVQSSQKPLGLGNYPPARMDDMQNWFSERDVEAVIS